MRPYTLLSLVLLLSFNAAKLQAQEELDLPPGFRDLGIPVRVTGWFSGISMVDEDGRYHYYQGRGQGPNPFFLLDTCLDTGVTKRISSNVEGANEPRGMLLASNGKIYISTAGGGHLFEYDRHTEKMRLIGKPGEQTYIWNLAEGTDGKIYGGTYPHAKLIRYDPKTDTYEDLGRMDTTENYVHSVVADKDGFVYGGIASQKSGIIAYNIESATWTQLLPEEDRDIGWGEVFPCKDGNLYASTPAGNFRLSKGQLIPVEELPPMSPKKGELFPDGRKLTRHWYESGRFEVVSPDGTKETFHYDAEGDGKLIFVCDKGPDGRIYGSSMLPLHMFVYDPDTRKMKDLGRAAVSTGEIYSFLNLKDELYLAAYPGCSVSRYDPKKPWKRCDTPDCNPRQAGKQSKLVYRPLKMCPSPDEERILICGLPDYGMLGGSISVFNPEIMEMEIEYRNVIPNQSVMDMCLTKEGLVAGVSAVYGGTGSHPTEESGHLFLWDYDTRELVFDTVPVETEDAVYAVLKGPDDLIYAMTRRGYLIVFDSESREIVHIEHTGHGHFISSGFELADNGRIIALFRYKVVEIEPGTYKHRVLAEFPNRINAGGAVKDGVVYFSREEHLIAYTLPDHAK